MRRPWFSDGELTPAAMVSTDHVDYRAGTTAVITGSGFIPGETVTLEVVHRDTLQLAVGDNPWSATAGVDGSFTSTWYVNPADSVGASFILSAIGSGGDGANTTFTDAGPVYPFYATANSGTTLVSINQDTGVATTIGSLGYTNTWTGAFTPDGTFWTIVNSTANASQLARVNLSTGQATPVGASPVTDQILALDANPAGQLYAGSHSGTFYSVNTSTGAFTKLDQLSIYTCDFAFDTSGNLWAVDGSSALYQLNPSTGAVMNQKTMSGLASGVMSIEVDPSNNFYVATFSFPAQLYLLNPASGATTLVGSNLGVNYIHGGDFLPAGLPTVSGLSPSAAAEGNSALTVTVNGTNFLNPSTVQWNGAGMATTFISSTQLQALVPAANLDEEGSVSITVVNKGGTSNAQTLTVQDAALSPGTVSASGGVEGVAPTILSAAFTDANHGAPTSDFSGTINWGDGNTTPFAAGAVSGSAGSYTVSGSHRYAEEGSYSITVTIKDVGGSSTSDTGSTTVADATLTPGPVSASGGVEGATPTSLSATFTDANTGASSTDFTATINWGDGGPTSTGSISFNGNTYTVSGVHTYAEEGSYPISIAVSDAGGQTTTITGTATVADAPLHATATPVSAAEGQPVTNVQVAAFTDDDPNGSVGDYTATLTWGDGETSTGNIIASGGGFAVAASKPHPYAEEGPYNVQVSIQDAGGATTDATTVTAGSVSTFAAPVGLSYPQGMAMDGSGNLYVANLQSNSITRITPAGVASTFVASGLSGPDGLAFDGGGNLYVANTGNNSVSKVTPAGVVSTFVTSGLNDPQGLAFDGGGNLYVANYSNSTVSKVSPAGVVSTFVSSGLTNPVGLAIDGSGNLYVANFWANSVSKVTAGGVVSTFATSTISQPTALTIDGSGNLYVANYGTNTVSKVTAGGSASTFASNVPGPYGLALDSGGNLYVSDYPFSGVSKVTPAGAVSTFFASPLVNPLGLALDGSGNLNVASYGTNTIAKVTSAGAVTTFASVPYPEGLAFDSSGNLYVADYNAWTVSKVTPAGAVSTFVPAGAGLVGPQDLAFDGSGNLYVANQNGSLSKVSSGGTVTTVISSGLSSPSGLAFDSSGDLYIANTGNNTVSELTPGGVLTTFVSTGLHAPEGLVFDSRGNLYVANASSNTVSEVTPGGAASTFLTGLNGPSALAIDGSGNLYVANAGNNTVVKAPFLVTTTPTVVGTATVADAPLTAGALTPPSATEGQAFSNVTVFHFTDADPNGTASDYVATVNTGNANLTSTANSGNVQIVANGGGFDVKFSYTYAEELSNQTFSVSVIDAGGASASASTSTFSVGDGGLTAGSLTPPAATEGVPFSNVSVFHFTDANPNATASDFTATITPGDGSTGPTVSTFVSNQSEADGLAFDSHGNLYVANQFGGALNQGRIYKVTPQRVATAFVDVQSPEAMVFDSSGNLYVATGLESILKINPSGGVSTFVAAGTVLGDTLAIDAGGNLYALATNSSLLKFTPSGTSSVLVFGSAWGATAGYLAVDSSGNIYVERSGPSIDKVTPTGAVTTFTNATSGLSSGALALDGSGNLYMANYASNTVTKVTSSGAVSTYVSSGLDSPFALAVDANGNLYVANFFTVSKVVPPASLTLTSTPSSLGQIVANLNGGFDVQLSYSYAEEVSNQTFAVQVTDAGGASISASTSTFGVADAALTGSSAATATGGVEGASVTTLGNAIFSDANTGAPATVFSTSINWGDGTPLDTSATVSGGSGSYRVAAAHLYAEEGTYSFTITVTDKGGSTTTITGRANVADAPLLAGTFTPPATIEGAPFSNMPVYHFTDADPAGTASDYTAVVTLGDGNTLTSAANPSNLQIVANAGGGFDVQLSYSYVAELSNQTFGVTVTDHNASASASTGTFRVADAAPTVTANSPSVGAPENLAATNSGTFADHDDPVTITASRGTISQNGTQSGTWSWSGTGDESTPYDVTITATNIDGTSATATFHVSFTGVAPTLAIAGAGKISAQVSYTGTNPESDNFNDNNTIVDVANFSSSPISQITLAGTGYGGTINGVTGSITFGNTLNGNQALQFNFQSLSPGSVVGNAAVFQQDFDDHYTGNVLYTLSALVNGVIVSGSFSPDANATGSFVPFLGNDQSGNSLDGAGADASLSFVDVLDIPTGTPGKAPENTPATTSGIFADYDDPVTITASRGTVSQSGSQSGTWTWSGTGDESAPYSVTITATNADGGTATTSFNVSFTDVPPTVTAAYPSVSAPENLAATNTGSFADYDDPVTITASSGTVSQIGSQNGSWSWSGSGDEIAPYNVTITATNSDGSTATTTFSVAFTDASITAGTVSASNGVEGVTPTSLGATFTDANTGALGSDFSGTINWGDGTVANPDITPFTASAVSGTGGSYTVAGSHRYTEEGAFPITVTINDVGGSSTSDSGSTTVADAALTGSTAATATGGVENLSMATLVGATFSDANTGALASDFTTSINWGDGTPLDTSATVSGSNGSFSVAGTHRYAEEGTYNFTITVTDDGGQSTTITGTTTVSDAPLANVANLAFSPTEGTPFSGTVASFTDTDPGTAGDPTTNSADYSATINWGDGSSSPGTIAYTGTPGNFTVNASGAPHTYAEEGSQAGDFSVVIHHGTLLDVTIHPVATWSTLASLPSARQELAAAAGTDGTVYALGGQSATGFSSEVDAYSLTTHSWSTLASLPSARQELAAAAGTDGTIYALGGQGATGFSSEVDAYSQTTHSWSTLANLPSARKDLAATAGTDGTIYAIGGVHSNSFSSGVDAYSPTTHSWTTLASLPDGRFDLAAATGADGTIYAIGGFNASNGSYSSEVDAYSPTTHSWTTLASLPSARGYLAAVSGPDGTIYAIGGQSSHGSSSEVDAYSPTTHSWSTLASLPTASQYSAAATGTDGTIYAIGGSFVSNRFSSEVDTLSTASSAMVADAALTRGGTATVGGSEGASNSSVLSRATFTDANPGDHSADMTAVITWGDNGPTSAGTVSYSGGVYTISGAHTYAEEGSYSISVAVSDDGGSSTTINGSATVADAPLTGSTAATATGGVENLRAATLVGATFTDANTGAPASDFTTSINWGDSTPLDTSATVSGSGGSYSVAGAHQYAEEGTYNFTITVSDDGGQTATITGSTTVSDANLEPGTVSASGGVEGVSPTSLSAMFTDANPGAPASDFLGTINWGDGHTTSFSSSAVSGSNGSYTVSGTHQYADEGPYSITVAVNDAGTSTATDSGATTVADAPLTAGTVNASGGIEGVVPTSLSATFTDANLNAPTSDFSGTINWGDGQTTSFTSSAVSGANGSYTVSGSHQYVEEGNYLITVTINDVVSSGTSDSGATTVADASLTAGTLSASSGVEYTTLTYLTAGFTDANLNAPVSDFSGTINWGDGKPATPFTASAVNGSNGSYTVTASYQYAEEGSYPIMVTINDMGSSGTGDTGTTTVADAPLTAGTLSASGGVEYTTLTYLTTTFTDANSNALSSDFSGTINWGDGKPATPFGSGAVSGSNGSYTVTASYQYAEEGSYPITVTINDVGTSTTRDSGTTTVTDAPLTAGTLSASGGIEYTTLTNLTTTFTDANSNALSSDFSGTINWGDGQTTSFTSSAVSGANGSYTVSGSHQYAEEGSYPITVTINDVGTSTATDSGTTTVADASLTAGTLSASGGVEGVSPTSLSATFSDANHGAPTSDFSGAINWGDGHTTAFTSSAVAGTGGSYTVGGSHQYAEEGNYLITLTINDVGSSTTTATGSTTVAEASLNAAGQNIVGVAGLSTQTVTVATFTDLGGAEPTADYSAVINWGDNTSSAGTIVANPNQTFSVQGSHIYASDASYTVKVHIVHENGISADTTSTATIKDNLGILLLDQTGKGALTDTGNGNVTVTGSGAIVVNSTNTQAASASGNGVVSAAEIDVKGTVTTGHGAFLGTKDNSQAPEADPLAQVNAPPVPDTVRSSSTLKITSSVTLQPGLYIGGIQISGQANVVLAPGIYYLQGGGFSVSGQATVTDNGMGVLLYNAPAKSSDGINFTGQGDVSLTGLTAAQLAGLGLSAPQYAGLQGLAIFQDRNSTATLSLSGQGNVNITGTIYAAAATIKVTGNGSLNLKGSALKNLGSHLIAADLTVTGNGGVNLDASDNNLQLL
jgi:hypothetical protein